jgi:hypothetical protein
MAKIEQEWTKIDKRNINQPFLAILFQKIKIKTSPFIFCEIYTSKIASNRRAGRMGIYNTKFTDSSLNATASENGLLTLAIGVTEPSVLLYFPQTVLLDQPPLKIARFH